MSTPGIAEYDEYTPAERWIIMSALMLGALMQVIDSSIVNVAIPTMMGTLGATLTQISWVSTGYIIASVIMLPLTGWMSHYFGRKRYLAASIMTFTLASFLCGTAHSLTELVVYRILQGAGGAALLSTALATMMEIFPPQQLGMVQAIYGMAIMVGPTIGPTLGGWITDNYNWPWIFFINVPLGIAASILAMLFVHDSRYARARTRIDIIGIALLAIGLGSLQLMLEKGNEEGWFSSNYILWLAFISVTGIVAFVLYELHIPNPAVNLRVMRNRSFTAGSIYGAVVGMGLFGGVFILPVFLQQLRHYTAQQSGVLMLPGALATAAMMPVVGKLSSKVPPRYLVVFGSITFIISSVMMRNLTMDTGPWDLFWPLVLRGAGMGFLFAPLTLVTLGGLKGHEIAEGTGLFSLLRQLGGSAGIALLSTFIDHQATAHRAILSEHLTMVNPLTQVRLSELQYLFQLKGFDPITAYYAGAKVTVMSLLGQAAVLSFIDAFLLIALVFVLAAPLLLLVDNNVPGGKPDIHAAAE